MTEAEAKEYKKEKAQLELLLSTSSATKVEKEHSSAADGRFKSADKAFAVDPTHREYRKVEQGHNKIVKRQSNKHVHKRRWAYLDLIKKNIFL